MPCLCYFLWFRPWLSIWKLYWSKMPQTASGARRLSVSRSPISQMFWALFTLSTGLMHRTNSSTDLCHTEVCTRMSYLWAKVIMNVQYELHFRCFLSVLPYLSPSWECRCCLHSRKRSTRWRGGDRESHDVHLSCLPRFCSSDYFYYIEPKKQSSSECEALSPSGTI